MFEDSNKTRPSGPNPSVGQSFPGDTPPGGKSPRSDDPLGPSVPRSYSANARQVRDSASKDELQDLQRAMPADMNRDDSDVGKQQRSQPT